MEFSHVYFVGIGGIGMSAIARYFHHAGKLVAGYDRTATPLTRELESEGIAVHYSDDTALIPTPFRDKSHTLVVYTPAIPVDHTELVWFRREGFELVKRSQVLGVIARDKRVMAVAGTHGKTTVTTMTAWFNRVITGGGSAFLGGISKNFDSNLVLGDGDRLAVEADEFDRSFLQLYPDVAVITAVDADHLDIYGDYASVRAAFSAFASQIKPGGALVLKNSVEIDLPQEGLTVYRYGYDTPCDFYARNVRMIEGGSALFDLVCPDRVVADCHTGIPGWVNVENTIAAAALVWCAGGFDDDRLREAIASFRGVRRRFDFYLNTPQIVYMDDYAHHPEELRAAITSLRGMFPGRTLTVLFQPHLYTRTRDFAAEFAASLSLADRVLLLPIYPARELPIEGVNSEMLLRQITVPHSLIQKEEILPFVQTADLDVLVTFGAGDIDTFCEPIAQELREKYAIRP
ncbi:MAG: UDP-N-acetylmuramate--L-alanine ligase [Rikenellaceae bacterium]|jgi:UDP-N-acetylmuramate--alanine ligase|nr:UDP-N-acetylmuramate--L-alanine ligase [Rikenellaceae bacterium]